MRWLLVVLLAGACTTARSVEPTPTPTPTEDPRVAALQARVSDLTQQVQTLTPLARGALTFSMWGYPQTIPRGKVLRLGLPDTFTIHLQFTATAPVRARIMSFDQFVQWMNTGKSDAITYPIGTSLDVVFHDAEGCAGYLLVLDSTQDVTITPNMTITRNPNPAGTGVCAD